MKHAQKGKFILDFQNLQKIVGEVLRQPKNQDVKIEIKQSPKSKSLYLYVSADGEEICLRVSDHRNKGNLREILVGETTGKSHIHAKIEKTIREVRWRKFRKDLERVKNEFQANKSDRADQ